MHSGNLAEPKPLPKPLEQSMAIPNQVQRETVGTQNYQHEHYSYNVSSHCSIEYL